MPLQPTYENLLLQLNNTQQEVLRLREENSTLNKVLAKDGIKYVSQRIEEKPEKKGHNNLNVEQRVELFRCLFKGREDVFARRWQSEQTGKVISLFAETSGVMVFAVRRNTSAQSVQTGIFCGSLGKFCVEKTKTLHYCNSCESTT